MVIIIVFFLVIVVVSMVMMPVPLMLPPVTMMFFPVQMVVRDHAAHGFHHVAPLCFPFDRDGFAVGLGFQAVDHSHHILVLAVPQGNQRSQTIRDRSDIVSDFV